MIIFFIPGILKSQNTKIDSLREILESSQLTRPEEFDVLFELSRQYLNEGYYEEGNGYLTRAFNKAKDFDDSLRFVKINRLRAQFLRRIGKIDSALLMFNKTILIATRNKYREELKTAINGLGVAYLLNGKFDEALKQFFKSLELHEKDGNQLGISISLHNIGLTHHQFGDCNKALQFYLRELKIKDQANISYYYPNTLSDISLCYAEKNNFVKAASYVARGLSTCGDNCPDEFLINAYFTLGVIALNDSNFSESETQFLKSYALSKKLGEGRLLLDNLNNLLKIYISRDQIFLAEKLLKDNEPFIQLGLDYRGSVIDLYAQLIELFSKSKNFQKLSYYQGRYIAVKDSVHSRQLTTNLMKIEADHLEKENRAKIKSQNRILALNEEIIQRQKYLNVFIGVVAALSVALAIVLFRGIRQKQRMNQLLDKKVSERTQELELNQKLLLRACDERDILIHKAASDIRSSLATIKGLCILGKKDINGAHQYLERVHATSDNFLEIIGKLGYNKLSIRN